MNQKLIFVTVIFLLGTMLLIIDFYQEKILSNFSLLSEKYQIVDKFKNYVSHLEYTNLKKNCVPNIFHWVWLYQEQKDLDFYQLICTLSALYIQKPEKVFLWNSGLPSGKWWNFLINTSKYLNIPILDMKMEAPNNVAGRSLNVNEHKTDVVRLAVLYDYGGIYMDLDVVVLKPLTPLMCYETTLGQETVTKLNNGFIMAVPGARFIKIWLDYYLLDFHDRYWDFNSVKTPFNLWHLYKDLVHVEENTIDRPNWTDEERYLIFQENLDEPYDWSKNYCLHTWFRWNYRKHNPDTIKLVNSTIGQIFRYIWYGSQDLIIK